jgi:hypothetical protein
MQTAGSSIRGIIIVSFEVSAVASLFHNFPFLEFDPFYRSQSATSFAQSCRGEST